ncbi:MAG: hypothetical protein BGO03_03330 [Mesorhizobium sp. 61-13]|nr:TRAP transporter small permease [Mesorhizobium sp.]OJU51170.1 MAG: hypothetical protein BGO03_03330 [Mesorhizobium sp. 61-13]
MAEETELAATDFEMSPPPAGRFSKGLNFVLENLAMALMAILTLLVFANAFSRYAFSAPLPWTEEAVTYLLVWLAAVGIIIAGLRQTLICCDIVTYRLRPGPQRIVATFCALLGSATMFYCAWLTWQYLQIFGSDLSPVLRIPKGVLISALLVALLGLAVTLLVPLFRRK